MIRYIEMRYVITASHIKSFEEHGVERWRVWIGNLHQRDGALGVVGIQCGYSAVLVFNVRSTTIEGRL
jgi:hypothetical protein